MLPRRNFLTASRPGHQALRRAQGFQDAESRTRKTRCRGARGSQQFKATYADVRIVRISDQRIGLRLSPERGTGKTLAVPNVTEDSNFGSGVRVIVNGAWGFASSPIVTPEEIARVTGEAVIIAKATASWLYRMMAQRIGREYTHSQTKTVFRNLLDLSGKVEVTATSVVVTLDKRAHSPYLVASGLADQPTSMPWFGDKKLIIQFA
jgi:hypothetical protein